MRAHKLQAVDDSQDQGKFLRVAGVPLVLNHPTSTPNVGHPGEWRPLLCVFCEAWSRESLGGTALFKQLHLVSEH